MSTALRTISHMSQGLFSLTAAAATLCCISNAAQLKLSAAAVVGISTWSTQALQCTWCRRTLQSVAPAADLVADSSDSRRCCCRCQCCRLYLVTPVLLVRHAVYRLTQVHIGHHHIRDNANCSSGAVIQCVPLYAVHLYTATWCSWVMQSCATC